MNGWRAGQSDFGYILKGNSVRGQLLKLMYCRCMLICVSVLVVLECLCVMAELMLDLHSLRVRFKHEDEELTKFLKESSDKGLDSNSVKSVTDLIDILKATEDTDNLCQCRKQAARSTKFIYNQQDENANGNIQGSFRENQDTALQKLLKNRMIPDIQGKRNYLRTFKDGRPYKDVANGQRHNNAVNFVKSRLDDQAISCDEQVFVFSFVFNDSMHLFVRSFDDFKNIDQEVLSTTSRIYQNEYVVLHKISHGIKYFGIAILSLMVIETLLKILCLGSLFLKKKVEVFDAFIVLVSFALDMVFIESNWYETEKDITTILVLLLPWRVVRILNSFLMTINHKHHIEMMNVRKAKKKVDTKFKKLKQLTLEMKDDIDHIISLAKLKGATQPEIINCLYSKRGHENKSLSAITGLASLMFISTLGKEPHSDAACLADTRDSAYGDLLRDIFSDDDTDAEPTLTEAFENKQQDLSDDIFVINADESRNYSTTKLNAKSNDSTSCMAPRQLKMRRRVTLPRRIRSCGGGREDNEDGIDNDGYEVIEERGDRITQSMSNLDDAHDGSNSILVTSTAIAPPWYLATLLFRHHTYFVKGQ